MILIVRQLSTKRWKRCYFILWLELSCSFQMSDRCFCEYVWHGTQLVKALCKTLWYDDISLLLSLCLLCDVEVLWMCYWICYECVMNVLWICDECVMDMSWVWCVMNVLWICYESVVDVLWMCYECVMDAVYECVVDVWGMLWMHWRWVKDVVRIYAWWMNDGCFISTV